MNSCPGLNSIDDLTDNDISAPDSVDVADGNQIPSSQPPLQLVRSLVTRRPSVNSMALDLQSVSRNFVAPSDLIRRGYTHPDFLEIFEIISASIDQSSAMQIARCLKNYFRMQGTRISCLRTTSVPKLINNRSLLPTIQWREGRDVDVLAFCKVPEEGGPCSFLMHVGVGIGLPSNRPWDCASIRWSVSNMAHLKELFSNAQHILGLLEWSDEDLKRLCLENCKDYTTDEYIHLFMAGELINKISENY